ncbi:MAG: adenylate/guanylate cyclase domain-containing protein [Candidatus Sulfotelmatobacter sp.]|jgi:class 3 adenylate cyclase
MANESDDWYKTILGLTGKGSESQQANSLFDWVAKNPDSQPLNNLSGLANVARRMSLPPISPPSSNNLLSALGASTGGPLLRAPIPVEKTPASPTPVVPDMNYIRRFVGAVAKKTVLVKDGRIMPSIDDLSIMEGRRVNAAFVYSDLHGFTKLVATQPVNKSFVFLHTFVEIASRLTKHYEGQVVDCAGDRVLSVFHRSPGDYSADPVHDAIAFALFLQTAFSRVIGPSFAASLGQLSLGIGIDYGPAVVGCVGIRGNKRIVFFGDAANKAAKLQEKAGPGETILSYDADVRKPTYLDTANGWTLHRETIEDGSTILRTTSIFEGDKLVKAR